MASRAEMEMEVKSSADKFWTAIRDSTDLFPKIFPLMYKSIEVVEGDGRSAGTVRLIKYAEEMPIVTFSKERLEAADDEKKVVSYTVIDGELVGFFKTFKVTLQVSPKADGGATVKWTMDFDKASDEVPEPDVVWEAATQTFHDLDEYLLKN